MEKLLLSLGLIVIGMSLGYVLQILHNRGTITLPVTIPVLRKNLQKIVVLFFMPVAFAAAIWIAPFDNIRIILLPLIAISVFFIGAVSGYLMARLLNKGPEQTGVLISSGFFANLGSIGGLICYIFLGEPGFALVVLYRLFEAPLYYAVGYPIAKFYSSSAEGPQPLAQRLATILKDPLVLTIMTALITGLSLNFSGVERPHFFATVTATFVPCGTLLMLISVGLGMNFGRVFDHLKEGLLIAAIKHLVLPVIACSIAVATGLGDIENGLPLKVVLVLSAMPVAFNTLIAASLYDLDLDLANSCWLISMLCLVIVIPVLYLLISSGLMA